MVRPATPSDRSPHDCAFCTCLDPRFDAVTLKTGERHSEFCCACGLPGPNDVASGRPVVDVPEHLEALVPGEIFVRSGDRWRKATFADEQRMLSHYALTGEWPGWCSAGTRPPLHHLAEPCSVGPYSILPPIERPLFDHKTALKTETEAEIPYDWPRRHASDKSGAERLLHGSGRFQFGDSTWYMGVDPGVGGDQGKTVFARREADGTIIVEAIDDTPPVGWSQDEIYERLRSIYQECAKQERLREKVKSTVAEALRSLAGEVNVSDVSTEKDREQGVMRANARLPALKTSLAWTWPGEFTVPSLSSENQPSLFIAKARSKTDGPSYRFSWESPAPAEPTPASTTEVNASTFAYAPGERDAYPVGQAPGEAARWAEILASTPRGPR